MPDLADLFVELSVWTWNLLDDASAAGFMPREETITEQLIVEMHRRAPGQLIARKTTPAEEKRVGADLALAIEVVPDLWLSLLVQAKKLDNAAGRYKELRKSEAISQAMQLIGSASDWQAVPLYLLYNGSALADWERLDFGECTRGTLLRAEGGPPWRTAREAAGKAEGCTPAGCTLVSAEHIRDLLVGSESVAAWRLLGSSAPLECLLCPFDGGGGGRPGVLPWPAWADERRPTTLDQGLDVPWLASVPPPWADALRNNDQPEDAPDVAYLVVLSQGDG